MRNLILGAFLVIWITMLISWLERHRMDNNLDAIFYVFTGIIVFLLVWRVIILKIIAHISPELWLKINQWTAPTLYDEAMKKRIVERKERREKHKNKVEKNEP